MFRLRSFCRQPPKCDATVLRSSGAFRTLATTAYLERYQVRNKPRPDMSQSTTTTKTGEPFDRALLESLMKRRLFYTPSFEIYQGTEGIETKGLFDYGPPGCSLQANIIDLWRKHFIIEEEMLEIDCPSLTPHEVLKTSGHVEKFADWMCKDPKNGDILRADHVVEEVLESRLKGDKEARGEKVVDNTQEEDAKKRKRKVKDTKAIKLDDETVREYEEVLAQVILDGQLCCEH